MDNYKYRYNVNKLKYYDLQKLEQSGGVYETFEPDKNISDELKKRNPKKKADYITFREMNEIIGDKPMLIGDLPDYMMNLVAKNFPPLPKPYVRKMMINTEGMYSITRIKSVWRIEQICQEMLDIPNTMNLKFVIATAGIGGEAMNLLFRCKHIWGYEYSPVQYSMLVNNVDVFIRYHKSDPSDNYTVDEKYYANYNIELYNDDFTANVDRHVADVMIVDPPWGGISYKNQTDINLKLGDFDMIDIIKRSKAKLYLIKLPFNHNFKIFQELEPEFTTVFYKLRKYAVVAVKRK
jgi:RNA cap guanine-N2 methyltransferase